MPRGMNHCPQEVTRDTKREQKAQAERRKASAITRSTGFRRRWRRFEFYRGTSFYLHISLSVSTVNNV